MLVYFSQLQKKNRAARTVESYHARAVSVFNIHSATKRGHSIPDKDERDTPKPRTASEKRKVWTAILAILICRQEKPSRSHQNGKGTWARLFKNCGFTATRNHPQPVLPEIATEPLDPQRKFSAWADQKEYNYPWPVMRAFVTFIRFQIGITSSMVIKNCPTVISLGQFDIFQ